MRKYLYFWINKYRRLDDFDEKKGYLFEDLGLNLSSEYNISHTYNDDKELSIKIEDNAEYIKDFYTSTICDIKTFVGNNGAGKTSLLRLISDIISKRDLHEHEPNLKYVLIYIDCEINENGKKEKKFYCYNNLPNAINLNFLGKKVEPFWMGKNQEDFSSKLTIFYSPSFSGNSHLYKRVYGNGKNYIDISTDALLLNDKESFSNPNTYALRFYDNGNQLFYYSILEQNRLVDFLLNAGSEFFDILPVPQSIKMQPSMTGIELAISDLSVKIINKYDVYEIIENELCKKQHKKWYDEYVKQYNEETRDYEDLKIFAKEFKYDKDELINDIKQSWMDYYHSIESLNDQFRFAALMSYTRTFYTNSYVKEIDNSYDKELDLNLKLNFLPKTKKDPRINEKRMSENWQNAEFWKKNIKIQQIKEHIEKIIINYDKCSSGYEDNPNGFATHENGYYQNGYIIFNLNEHHSNLERVRKEYNSIFKLTDFISFGFTRPLSSGEDQFLRFYSRFYTVLKDVYIDKPVDSIHLFIDEGELYLHPEWQRKWLDIFIKLMQNIEKTIWHQYDANNNPKHPANEHIPVMLESRSLQIQLFLATHSPFMLTDFKGDNIIKLQRKKDEDGNRFGKVVCVNEKINSFAGNIYDILKEGFFLEGTLGYRTERKLKDLIRDIEKGEVYSETLISQIGDPILKALILQKKGNSNDKNKN